MQFINQQLNGFNTYTNFLASCKLKDAKNAKEAKQNYENAWFSGKKKNWLKHAYQLMQNRSKFWSEKILKEILEEVVIYNDPEIYDQNEIKREADELIAMTTQLKTYDEKKRQLFAQKCGEFGNKYKYTCPDAFKYAWMNNGAYITLKHAIMYQNLTFPNKNMFESLLELEDITESIIKGHDNDTDDRLFNVCYFVFSQMKNNP